MPNAPIVRKTRWPPECIKFVQDFVEEHPCFYIEELQRALQARFPSLPNISTSTICRALRFDLDLTRKVLTKRARESVPAEIDAYYKKLAPFYSGPEQLVFLDETAKDGRDVLRRFAWSARNTPAIVRQPFDRGDRVSILAAMDVSGFIAWDTTPGTFDRRRFHQSFLENVAPLLNPWPLPRSIVILDNAKIHMYRELEELVHSTGALLFFLPPYSPQLNPIEVGFGLLKRWLTRHTHLAFRFDAKRTLQVAMRKCMEPSREGNSNLYGHCGYDRAGLNREIFFS